MICVHVTPSVDHQTVDNIVACPSFASFILHVAYASLHDQLIYQPIFARLNEVFC